MAIKLVGVMNIWQSSLWLPYVIEGCYPYLDLLIVNESCWMPNCEHLKTSPDRSLYTVNDYIKKNGLEDKIKLSAGGWKAGQPNARNTFLRHVPDDCDYLFQIDSDEFYFPEDLQIIRQVLEDKKPSSASIPSRNFYFDFFHYLPEGHQRIWEYWPGQRYHSIASMYDRRGQGLDLRPFMKNQMFHMSYVTDHSEGLRLKACIGEDIDKDTYNTWYDNVFTKYSINNPDSAYEKNPRGRGIHVFGHGELQEYTENIYPSILDSHPLRNKLWGT